MASIEKTTKRQVAVAPPKSSRSRWIGKVSKRRSNAEAQLSGMMLKTYVDRKR
jgi:hypothetical protein